MEAHPISTLALERGLSAAQVAERVSEGRVNRTRLATSRPIVDILAANVFTFFNALLAALVVVVLLTGSWRDALFGLVVVINSAVGIVQEIRAKITLDRLRLVHDPKTRVVRDGAGVEIAVDDVVADDVVSIGPGDQVVADGDVLEADGLEIDESLLTGESVPVVKAPGDRLLSGSFVAAGAGAYVATAVGAEAYSHRLAAEGRRFVRTHSEIQSGVNAILRVMTVAILPIGALLAWSQYRANPADLPGAVSGTVAALVGMIPEGLVLLVSIAFAVSAMTLARRRALVQELAAVETLARVDVVCTDKTGTLTEPLIALDRVEPLDASDAGLAREALGALAAASVTRNATISAIAAATTAPDGWTPDGAAHFSSARKWSGATFEGRGAWVLGAPDVLLADSGAQARARARAAEMAVDGARVLVLARTEALPVDGSTPVDIGPVALVILRERLRPDAAETIRYFGEQGVSVKVISGDDPSTVALIATQAGVPGADRPVDGRHLPEDAEALATIMESSSVFGRVTPEQKRRMVEALQSRGHVVAMTGDGVNDVLSLKKADIGIAMGSGAAATRAVAQLVLLDGCFSVLPGVVAEGRRVIANTERVSNLFLTKTTYAALLAVVAALVAMPYPFLPRHLTLVGSLTIGIPAFFLALAPNSQLYRPGFVRRVLRFAVPSGAVAGLAVLATWYSAVALGATRAESRSLATVVLAAIGLVVIAELERPMNAWKWTLLAAMGAGLALVLAWPFASWFFALTFPASAGPILAAAGSAASGAALVAVVWRWQGRA